MNEINLKMTVDEVNIIIESLSQLPFAKVYKIIEKIHLQANKDLNENSNQQKINK